MAESIISIIASVLGLAAGIGLDALLGKWVAYFTIAWEGFQNENAKKAFGEAVAAFKAAQKPNDPWDAFRRSAGKPEASAPAPKAITEVEAKAKAKAAAMKDIGQVFKE